MTYTINKRLKTQKEKKRQLILDTSSQLFVKLGYHHTSVKDIVNQCGISVGSFYFYFSSKEEVLETLYNEMNEAFLTLFEEVFNDTTKDFVDAFINAIVQVLILFHQHQELSKILLNHSVSTSPIFEKKRMINNQRFLTIIKDKIELLKSQGLIDCDHVEVSAMIIMGGIFFLITNLLETKYSFNHISNYAYAIVLYHLRAFHIPHDKEDINRRIKKIINNHKKRVKHNE